MVNKGFKLGAFIWLGCSLAAFGVGWLQLICSEVIGSSSKFHILHAQASEDFQLFEVKKQVKARKNV